MFWGSHYHFSLMYFILEAFLFPRFLSTSLTSFTNEESLHQLIRSQFTSIFVHNNNCWLWKNIFVTSVVTKLQHLWCNERDVRAHVANPTHHNMYWSISMNLKDEHQSVASPVLYLIKCQLYRGARLLVYGLKNYCQWHVTEARKVNAKSCMVYVKHTY